MKTLIIVKSKSERYYIYNANGKCVAFTGNKHGVYSYLDELLSVYAFKSYVFKATAAPSTFIVNML